MKKIQLTEKQLKSIIEKVLYENSLREEETHGSEPIAYETLAGLPIGFEGWSSETVPGGVPISDLGGSSDFGSSSSYDSDDFDLSESLKRNLRNIK